MDGGVRLIALTGLHRDATIQERYIHEVGVSELQQLASQIHYCTDCPLSVGRTKAVPGEGPEDAELMFIGEGPGFNEDQQGRPFVGAAGNLLAELLTSIGMTRSQVYITNMVKCRPPNNRDPLPEEITSCSKYLDRQIALIDPKVVVTLGRYSLSKFMPGGTIGKLHGKPNRRGNFTVYPVYHPAAGLRQQSLRTTLQQDFKIIPDLLRELVQPIDKTESAPQQLGMFN